MPTGYDPQDPFGLRKLMMSRMVPAPGDDGQFPSPPPADDGVKGGPHDYFPEPRGGDAGGANFFDKLNSMSGGGGGGAAPPAAKATADRVVGAKPGAPDLFGVGDLVNNIAFQRLWEGYNAPKRFDDPGFDFLGELTKNMSGNDALTRHKGEGAGWLWGYVDPSWLPGFSAGRVQAGTPATATPETGGGGNLRNVLDLILGGGGGGVPVPPFKRDRSPDDSLPIPI